MAKITKIDDEYYVEYSAQGLQFRKKAGKSEAQALKLLAEIENNAGPEEFHHKSSVDVDIADFIEEFVAGIKIHYSSKTQERFQQTIKFLSGFLKAKYPELKKIHQITPKVVIGFQEFLKQDAVPILDSSQVNFHLWLLRDFFDQARAKGYINDNPLLHVRLEKGARGKTPRVFKDDELKLIIEKAEAPIRFIIPFLIATGLRVEEFAALQWTDIDTFDPSNPTEEGLSINPEHISVLKPENRRIDYKCNCIRMISYQGRGQGQNLREIPLTHQAADALKALQKIKRPGQEIVFESLTQDQIKERIDYLIKESGLSKEITFNSLRHTFARDALSKGISLIELHKLMGIDDVWQVMMYEGFVPEESF